MEINLHVQNACIPTAVTRMNETISTKNSKLCKMSIHRLVKCRKLIQYKCHL